MGDFTPAHFKLLDKWKNQKRDKTNPEQNSAYEELERAYEITENWAYQLQKRLFPRGRVEIRKRPTNQGNHFASYNWARIYPSPDSPKELAYTVGIDASLGFVVKIDTVKLDDSDPVRKAYLSLRGAHGASPISATLSAADGLGRSLGDLVDWSADAIRKFSLRYDEVAAKLGVGHMDDATLLSRFDGKADFKVVRSGWSADQMEAFCRLARAVHDAGLDWWHTDIKAAPQIRFGRKQPGAMRASGVLGYLHCGRATVVATKPEVPGVSGRDWTQFTPQLADKLVAEITAAFNAIDSWKPVGIERPGLWPDQLQSEQGDPSDSPPVPVVPDQSAPTISALNRIYYGPPGTGKTYELNRILEAHYEEPMSTVPLEEWRAQFIAERVTGLTWWEVAAVALCDLGGSARVSQLLEHPFVLANVAAKGRSQNVRQTLWGSLQQHAIEDSNTVKIKSRLAPAVFDKTEDSVWNFAGEWGEAGADLRALVNEYQAGPPQTGASIKRYSFVTFHQSFGYEEFVEGLRPVLEQEGDSTDVKYEIRSGAFKDLCDRARQAPGKRFAMVIDEINRGNISKIFGELITLIEPDKRKDAENAISVTLPYSREHFSVPANVDIIGTMNTADRSLALLDTALRRRFEFVPVMPDARDEPGAPLAGLRITSGEQVIDVPRMLDAINQRIESLYDRDHCIGHAYFTSLAKVPDGAERLAALRQIFKVRILPLLEEYFFEDWQKIRLVLADNQKPTAAQFIRESADHEAGLARLFGGDHGLDSYATKRRYALQNAAFLNADAYTGIYKTLSGRQTESR